MVDATNSAKGREVLGHHINSTVMESHHLQGLYNLPLSAILFKDRSADAQTAQLEQLVILFTHSEQHIRHCEQRDQEMAQWIETHPDLTDSLQRGASPKEVKIIRK